MTQSKTLSQVLWIGGPCGTGKTTICRRLAHRHDLRAYNSDAHTWEHHDRSIAADDGATLRWESLSPDERWVTMDPAEMAELSLELNAERFRRMVDDVCALPRSPLVVMEGTPLLPWLVEEHLASDEHAVWLMPSAEFQRARLLERPTTTWDQTSDPVRARANRIERELRVAEAIGRAAEARGFTMLQVDESRDLGTVQAAVEEAFAAVLARGPRAATQDERRALRRAENATLLQQLQTYLARVPEAGNPDRLSVAFSCECGSSGCGAQPAATVAGYAQLSERGEPLVLHE